MEEVGDGSWMRDLEPRLAVRRRVIGDGSRPRRQVELDRTGSERGLATSLDEAKVEQRPDADPGAGDSEIGMRR